MAQRDLHRHRHGAGSGVTRRCPDKEIYGRFELDAISRLDLGPAAAAPLNGRVHLSRQPLDPALVTLAAATPVPGPHQPLQATRPYITRSRQTVTANTVAVRGAGQGFRCLLQLRNMQQSLMVFRPGESLIYVTEMVMRSPLGAALRVARKQAGLSLRAAAEGSGISYSTLSRIENGHPVSSLEAAIAVARNVGLDEREVQRLASGGLALPGAAAMAEPGLRRAMSGGRFSPRAMAALRQVHLRELASEFSAGLGGGRPVDVRLAAKHLRLALALVGRLEAGFDSCGMTYRLPAAAHGDSMKQRLWSAHGIAHRLIANDSGAAPQCLPKHRASTEEQEAAYVASHVLVPAGLLATELRQGPLPSEPESSAAFNAALERVASRFRVPPRWAAARLAEDMTGELSW